MLNSIRVLQHIIIHPVRKRSSGDQVHIGGDSRPGETFDSVRNQVDNSDCIHIQLTAGKADTSGHSFNEYQRNDTSPPVVSHGLMHRISLTTDDSGESRGWTKLRR
jgi:hypothetical protein